MRKAKAACKLIEKDKNPANNHPEVMMDISSPFFNLVNISIIAAGKKAIQGSIPNREIPKYFGIDNSNGAR